ncbi:MAG: hypothetical protein CME31_14680 [Gimesia sp.]|uniref:AAA+ ATPase domain-containing protein n=1 Tax=Gimesia maris TaxID=122 RepID=A0A3D3R9N6_9PLAN|nr:hypothetical protein [Gimesia sp.]HCO25306.1 hypothetical protein [Gimesia maris]
MLQKNPNSKDGFYMPRLKTYLSPVNAFFMDENICQLKQLQDNEKKLYWIDSLLDGGIELTESIWKQESTPYLLLISGPPGTGKTTFVLELCKNLAENLQQPDIKKQPYLKPKHFSSFYFSLEKPADRIIANIASYGWGKDEGFFTTPDRIKGKKLNAHSVIIDSEYLLKKNQVSETIGKEDIYPIRLIKAIKDFWNENVCKNGDLQEFMSKVFESTNPDSLGETREITPEVVVIDSLNILWGSSAEGKNTANNVSDMLRAIRTKIAAPENSSFTSKPPCVLIVILDSPADGFPHGWEFEADGEIRFNVTMQDSRYYRRTFQIKKLGNQSHSWGEHELKIYPSRRTEKSPFISSGGAFVFPSVHRHLSKAKYFGANIRSIPNEAQEHRNPYRTSFESLDEILADEDRKTDLAGFPANKTTAFLGERGTMKSHLADRFLLYHALGNTFNYDSAEKKETPKNVLLISLRDDEAAVRNILAQNIYEQELVKDVSDVTGAMNVIKELELSDRLEIMFNPPGYIGPGELLHRIFVGISRQRARDMENEKKLDKLKLLQKTKRNSAELVVVSGLEQFEAKFPLCAEEPVFIPALVSLFREFGVCSIFVASGQDSPLTRVVGAMSDLVLEFKHFSKRDKYDKDFFRKCVPTKVDPNAIVQSCFITGARVPAGQLGGRTGLLGRTSKGEMSFYVPSFNPGDHSDSDQPVF